MASSMVPVASLIELNTPITLEELKAFHSIDRELYTRLVINLRRSPADSMQVIALWIWLEEMNYPNIILKMLTRSDVEVNLIANEASKCLECMESGIRPTTTTPNNDLPLTLGLMNKDISLMFFYENRIRAINGITKIVNDVCSKAFSDILDRVMVIKAQEIALEQLIREESSVMESGRGRPTMLLPSPLQPGVRPRSVHPLALGRGIGVRPFVPMIGEGSSSQSALNPMAPSWDPNEKVPEDERTLFVTFSRGYPMTERELREFLVRAYGDCIESIHMQEVPPHIQPLYARVVLRSASKIPIILDGKDKAQFIINGKHVRARRYEAK